MSSSAARILLSTLLVSSFAPGVSRAQFAPPALDHFMVYVATNGGLLEPPFVTLQDQFQVLPAELERGGFLLVPARKNQEPLLDPLSHLRCYPTQAQNHPPLPPGGTLRVRHQFGEQSLTLSVEAYACTPTEKYPQIPPQPITIDHFVCYGASATGLAPVIATFADQFTSGPGQISLQAGIFCSPATKGHGVPPFQNPPPPVEDPTSHLYCTGWTPFSSETPPPGIVPIKDQFGSDELTLGNRDLACLPTTKIPPTGTLDHFLYYDAVGPDGPPVTVVDQFGPLAPITDLGPVRSFLVPADKNQEGLIDPVSHLTGYALDGPPSPVERVRVTHQFGVRELRLGPQRELWVPTQKLLGQQGAVSIDHFACYEATGGQLDETVSVTDQFHTAAVQRQLREPFLFCNPADKNQEGVFNLEDHVTCYRTEPAGLPIGPIPIRNQFAPVDLPIQIDVGPDVALCLPSKKEIVAIEVPGLPLWGIAALAAALFAVPALIARRQRGAFRAAG